MEKPTIITIAGAIGSGKSTTANRLAADLGYRRFSSGDLFRAIAKERNVSIEEINRQAELEKDIDKAVDKRLRDMQAERDLVIDSRMAFHWLPQSFKVYLALDPETAAERIYAHIQRDGRVSQNGSSADDVFRASEERRTSERRRYQKLYGVDIENLTPFDLVIDTGSHTLDEVVGLIRTAYDAWRTS